MDAKNINIRVTEDCIYMSVKELSGELSFFEYESSKIVLKKHIELNIITYGKTKWS